MSNFASMSGEDNWSSHRRCDCIEYIEHHCLPAPIYVIDWLPHLPNSATSATSDSSSVLCRHSSDIVNAIQNWIYTTACPVRYWFHSHLSRGSQARAPGLKPSSSTYWFCDLPHISLSLCTFWGPHLWNEKDNHACLMGLFWEPNELNTWDCMWHMARDNILLSLLKCLLLLMMKQRLIIEEVVFTSIWHLFSS